MQRYYAHSDGYFIPDYAMIKIDENTDEQTVFLQTGVSPAAQKKLKQNGEFDKLYEIQKLTFSPPSAECHSIVPLITREDSLGGNLGPEFCDIKKGDIILTLSTHSFGWRHGHAGLVVDGESTLECALMGTKSEVYPLDDFRRYSNYVVLRLKDGSEDLGEKIADYALNDLIGIDYHLTSGFIGPKAPSTDAFYFGMHCTYLVWYAYNHFGLDIDSDGGRLVSSVDILNSDLFEVVQVFGMDMKKFVK